MTTRIPQERDDLLRLIAAIHYRLGLLAFGLISREVSKERADWKTFLLHVNRELEKATKSSLDEGSSPRPSSIPSSFLDR